MYKTKSKRIKRFLYNLGFEFIVEIDSIDKEVYIFKESEILKESVDFYYKVRKSFQNK